jgi:3-oxoacyl-[acyl-carrier-protein] synthase III
MRNAHIIATAMSVPEKIVPNSWFDELLGENVSDWLVTNLTIRERRWCGESESVADLTERAALKLLQKANLTAKDIDLLIVATDTPEYISPSTASVVHHRLGMDHGGSFDVNTACAGFVTAVDMGSKYIRSDEQYRRVMVIGAYAMSKYLNLKDKKTVTLFADGAAGVILEAGDSASGWLGSLLHTEGQYHDWMGIYGGGTHAPILPQNFEKVNPYLQFVKKFPKEINPATWTKMVQALLKKTGYSADDVGMIFFTQININSIRETMENLNIPMRKTHTVMDRFGYTGSACIPMALTEAEELGKLKPGDLVIFMGSGGGLAFATAAFKW